MQRVLQKFSSQLEDCLSLTTGEGPIHSLLHQLVFGDDSSEDSQGAAEEGRASAEVVVKPREAVTEMSGGEYWWKLAVCVVGLQASYLTWGVLQVYIPYPNPIGSVIGPDWMAL